MVNAQRVAAPVPWARSKTLSQLLINFIRPRQPTVLVLSLPRSGSSWAGEALGCAIDALYLREPVTQSDHTLHRLTALRYMRPIGLSICPGIETIKTGSCEANIVDDGFLMVDSAWCVILSERQRAKNLWL